MAYKFLEHTADIKILAEEKSLEGAFISSALAMKEIILDHEKINVKPSVSKFLNIEGNDYENLLCSFLEEFLYLLDAENFIMSEIESLEISKDRNKFVLSCHVLGDKASNYRFVNKVKAVTFNEMFVKKEGKNFKIQFILDV